MILLAEHDEPSLAAKKKQRHVASETAISTPKNRVWNFFGSPLGQIRSESDLSAETATGSVQFSYETASGQAYYYTRDHLHSVREMCDSSGSIVARYTYDPYGRVTLAGGTNLATFQHTGNYYHAPSGLNLTPSRAYDSNTGRWLSRDPIQENGGIDLYGYVNNDPTEFTDRSGLEGTWTFDIDSSGSGRPDIHVTYTMSAEEAKCCDLVVIQRWILDVFGFHYWKDNDTSKDGQYGQGSGARAIPATPGEDQPGGQSGGLLDDPTILARDFNFKWCAICAKGKPGMAGKTLSCRQKTYHQWLYHGFWVPPS